MDCDELESEKNTIRREKELLEIEKEELQKQLDTVHHVLQTTEKHPCVSTRFS